MYIVIDTRQYIKILRSSCCCCCSNATQIKGDLIKIYPQQTVTMRRARNARTEIPIGRANNLTLITILILHLFNLIYKYPIKIIFTTAKIIQHSLIYVSSLVSASIESCYAPSCCYAQLSGWQGGIYIAQPKQTSGKQEETKCII